MKDLVRYVKAPDLYAYRRQLREETQRELIEDRRKLQAQVAAARAEGYAQGLEHGWKDALVKLRRLLPASVLATLATKKPVKK